MTRILPSHYTDEKWVAIDRGIITKHTVKQMLPAHAQFVEEVVVRHECNWKISVENYLECYHCRFIHADTLMQRVVDDTGFCMAIHDKMVVQTSPGYASTYMFPNRILNVYGEGFIRTGEFRLVSRDTTDYVWRYYDTGAGAAHILDFIEWYKGVVAEDSAVVASVQKGMQSLDRFGPLNMSDDPNTTEQAVDFFRLMLGREYNERVG